MRRYCPVKIVNSLQKKYLAIISKYPKQFAETISRCMYRGGGQGYLNAVLMDTVNCNRGQSMLTSPFI